jgi:hypothetical protein
MAHTKDFTRSNTQAGDAAVNGLIGGVLAGMLMLVLLILLGLVSGQAPGLVLGRFSSSQEALPLRGAMLHLAVSGVYGVLFGLITWIIAPGRRLRIPFWFAGTVYGLLLWLLAWYVLLPGLDSPIIATPVIHLFLGHLLFGASLGIIVGRFEKV